MNKFSQESMEEAIFSIKAANSCLNLEEQTEEDNKIITLAYLPHVAFSIGAKNW